MVVGCVFITEEFQLEQIVSSPTHGSSILDLCFMSHPDRVVSCESYPGFSDHNIVLVNISSQLNYFKQPPRKINLSKKANWDTIHHDLLLASDMYFNLNFTSFRSVEENWTFFHQQYLNLVQKYVPSKLLSTRHCLPWLQRLYNTAKFYNKSANWVEYKTLQHRVRNLL